MRDIARVVKKLANLPEMPVETEESVQKACYHYGKFIAPATLYQTFAKDAAALDFSAQAPSKWVAQSYYIVTIGDRLEEEFKKNEKAFGDYTPVIVSAIAVDALDQSKNFVARLLAKEAQTDKCEISRPQELPKEEFDKVCTLLESAKIGVEVIEQTFKPQYTSAGIFYWTPVKKRK